MNTNYGDLFGGGAGTHGQDVSEANIVNSLRAFQQNSGLPNPNEYSAIMSQFAHVMGQHPPTSMAQYGQYLQNARPPAAAEHILMQQRQQQQEQQLLAHHHQQQQASAHQQPKPRVSNTIPHKSVPSQYKGGTHATNLYHQYQMSQQSQSGVGLTHSDLVRPMQGAGAQGQQTASHPSMDYSIAQQHQQVASLQQRVAQAQPHSHDLPGYNTQQNTETATTTNNNRLPPGGRSYMPSKSMPMSQSQPLSHQSPQQRSPRDQPRPTSNTSLPANSNYSNLDLSAQRQDQQRADMQQIPSHSNKPQQRPPSFVPYKMDSMRKAAKEGAEKVTNELRAAQRGPQAPPAAHSSHLTSGTGSSQPSRSARPAARVPYKMDSMRQAQQQAKLRQQETSSINQSVSPATSSTSHISSPAISSAATSSQPSSAPSKDVATAREDGKQGKVKVSNVVPYKMAAMRNASAAERPPDPGTAKPAISRYIPHKTASMHKHSAPALAKPPAPAANAAEESSSSSSGSSDSSSSSSSSDESEDDTKANSSSVEKKTAAPPAPAMTTATPPVAPPVAQPAPPTRTKIPYKSAGNFSTPKPTNTVPTKKPMGKPLSLIKEKHGKDVNNTPKPKTTGKPDSMLQFIAQNEIGGKPMQTEDQQMTRKRPGRQGKPATNNPKSDAAVPPVPQFEAISDTEAEPVRKRRGRPPKAKDKEMAGASKSSPVDVPATPFFEMPPTPQFTETPAATPKNPGATPMMGFPATPQFGAETPASGDLFSPFMATPTAGADVPNRSPSKRSTWPKKQTGNDGDSVGKSAAGDDIMDIVSDVKKSINDTLDKPNEDAPFELMWTGPMATPRSDHLLSSSSILPPYTPMSTSLTASPFPLPPTMSGRTPFNTMKTPFSSSGGMTPFNQPPVRSALPQHVVTDSSIKNNSGKSPSRLKEDEVKKKRSVRKGGRRKKQTTAPPVAEQPNEIPEEQPESPQAFFAGFHDMPPMDVSGKSFQLDSRSRNAEANKEAEQSREKPSRLPPPPALGAKLFDVLDNSANRGEEKTQGEDDAPDKTKKKRDKKPKSKKPYPVKRPSKIKHLDPIFIGDMEQISTTIGECSLYDEKPLPTPQRKYILAFGEYALVNPPPSPAQVKVLAAESHKGRSKTAAKPKQKAEKLKIKVKLDDIKPPSIDESEPTPTDGAASAALASLQDIAEETTQPTESLPSDPTPAAIAPPVPPVTEDSPAVPQSKKEEESKENKAVKPLYDSTLSAPEVAQKYYVNRPKSRIATKNICFSKSKTKKPKFGKGSSPKSAGMSPHLSDHELVDGERRQLPSRKSRPQQMFDDGVVPGEELSADDPANYEMLADHMESGSPITKRGRGRPPKLETEIPHTNLVRTNQMFLPLKKRHKMVMEEYADLGCVAENDLADSVVPEDTLDTNQPSPTTDRPQSSQSRKRPGSALQRELLALTGDEMAQTVTDLEGRKKRKTAAGTLEQKSQPGGGLSALQAAMEMATSQAKAKTDKPRRKNPAPTRNTLASLSTNTQRTDTDTPDEMDLDDANDSGEKQKSKDGKKKNAKNSQGKNQALHYKKINKCIYLNGVKPLVPGYEPHGCNCQKPADVTAKSCNEDCLNRMMYIECIPQTCPCGEQQCGNMRIQKQTTAHGLEKIQTNDRGFGVKTTNLICSGEFILEYTGEVVSIEEFRRRMTFEYARDHHHYCLTLDSKFVIDGYRMGNIGRFVNHSCEPNCEMQKWNVNGVYRIGLFALKDISPGEELTYDYNFKAFNMDAQQKCFCGSTKCRKFMGGKAQALAALTKTAKKKSRPNGPRFNPKDPVIIRQKAIMMPSDEKRFVKLQQCFLMRNMTGHPPPILPPKKTNSIPQFRMLLPFQTSTKVSGNEYRVPSKAEVKDEEVIRCICGVLREEGDMLMCDKCEVWQHCDCVGVKPDVESYLCEQCSGRKISGEVEMIPPPPDGSAQYKYYLSLEHGSVHVAVGDAVFMTPTDPNLGVYAFRIERLWKNEKGDKYVYGFFYYLPWKLPNRVETTKKFYPNEVIQTKFYDILPLRNVLSHCYVIDEKSYVEGRPKDYTGEKDVFICEYELDKLFRELKKITKRREAELVNKYHYAFSYFKKPLELKQYQSHILKKSFEMKKEVKPENVVKPRKTKKTRLTAVEDIVKTLAGKTKLALVDGHSVTKKVYADCIHIVSKPPPKPPVPSKPKSKSQSFKQASLKTAEPDATAKSKSAAPPRKEDKPSPKQQPAPGSKAVKPHVESAKRSGSKDVKSSKEMLPTKVGAESKDSDYNDSKTKSLSRSRNTYGKTSKTPADSSGEKSSNLAPERMTRRSADTKGELKTPKDADAANSNTVTQTSEISTERVAPTATGDAKKSVSETGDKIGDSEQKAAGNARKSRRPPEKKQAQEKSKKGKDLNKSTRPPTQGSLSSLPRIPKKRTASEVESKADDSNEEPTRALRRGRSSSVRSGDSVEPPAKSLKSDNDKSASTPDKSKPKSSPDSKSSSDVTTRNKTDSRSKSDNKTKIDSKSKDDKETSGSKARSSGAGKPRTDSKVKDRSQTKQTELKEKANKEMEEGKSGKQMVLKLDKIDKVPKPVAEATQKVQITISPANPDSAVDSKPSAARAPNVNVKTPIVVKKTEPGKPPVVSNFPTASKSVSQTKSLSTAEKSNVKESSDKAEVAQIQKRGILKNAVPMLKISPITLEESSVKVTEVTAEKPAIPEPKASSVEEASGNTLSVGEKTDSVGAETPSTQEKAAAPKAKSKRIVPLKEVLERRKLAAAEKAAEASLQDTKLVELGSSEKVAESKQSTEQPAEPASPTKAPVELLSPTISKPMKTPKVIPLIPLSPTHESDQANEVSLPRAIPLDEPTPLSPTDKGPSSPTTEHGGPVGMQPKAIPLSPTSLKTPESVSKIFTDRQAELLSQLVQPTVKMTHLLPTSMSSLFPVNVNKQPVDMPAFLTASTDDEDSDTEPGLSIAEDAPSKPTSHATPAKSDSQTVKEDEKDEHLEMEHTSSDRKASEAIPERESATKQASTPGLTEMSLPPVFGLGSSSFSGFDSMLARPLNVKLPLTTDTLTSDKAVHKQSAGSSSDDSNDSSSNNATHNSSGMTTSNNLSPPATIATSPPSSPVHLASISSAPASPTADTSVQSPQDIPIIPQETPIIPQQETPAVPQETHVIPLETPAIPQEAPVIPQEIPSMPIKMPLISQQTSIIPQETSIIPEETPAIPQEAPTIPQETPAISLETPAIPLETPVIPQETPITPEETLSIPTEMPSMSSNSSVSEVDVRKQAEPVESPVESSVEPIEKETKLGAPAYERCVSSVHEPDEPSSPLRESISSLPVVNIPLDEEYTRLLDTADSKLPSSVPEVFDSQCENQETGDHSAVKSGDDVALPLSPTLKKEVGSISEATDDNTPAELTSAEIPATRQLATSEAALSSHYSAEGTTSLSDQPSKPSLSGCTVAVLEQTATSSPEETSGVSSNAPLLTDSESDSCSRSSTPLLDEKPAPTELTQDSAEHVGSPSAVSAPNNPAVVELVAGQDVSPAADSSDVMHLKDNADHVATIDEVSSGSEINKSDKAAVVEVNAIDDTYSTDNETSADEVTTSDKLNVAVNTADDAGMESKVEAGDGVAEGGSSNAVCEDSGEKLTTAQLEKSSEEANTADEADNAGGIARADAVSQVVAAVMNTADEQETAADNDEALANKEVVLAEEKEVAANEQGVAADEPETAADEPEVAADEQETAADEPEAAADEPEVATDEPEVAADEQETAADEPEAAADEPEVAADEPEIAADEPEVAENEPEVAADEPEVAADEPETAADEPEVTTNEQEVTADEPEITADEPEVAENEPEVTADEPEVAADEPETATDEPEAAADEPNTAKDEQEVTADEPEIAADEPEVAADEPETAADEPEVAADEPETAADEPEVTTNEQEVTADEPEIAADEPEVAENEPEVTADEPEVAADEPETATDEPEVAADEPETAADEPEVAADEPETAADEPEVTTNEQEVTADEPEIAADEPEVAENEPEVTADEPEVAADEPETATDEPEAAADEPNTAKDEQEVTADEPEIAADEPEVAADEPEVTGDEQETAANEPETAADESNTEADEKKTAAEEQEVTADEPNTATDEPETAAEKQEVAEDEQEIAENEPEVAAGEPETAADEPETAADEPEVAADEPETAADEPEVTADEPEVEEGEQEVAADEPEVTANEPEVAADEQDIAEDNDRASEDREVVAADELTSTGKDSAIAVVESDENVDETASEIDESVAGQSGTVLEDVSADGKLITTTPTPDKPVEHQTDENVSGDASLLTDSSDTNARMSPATGDTLDQTEDLPSDLDVDNQLHSATSGAMPSADISQGVGAQAGSDPTDEVDWVESDAIPPGVDENGDDSSIVESPMDTEEKPDCSTEGIPSLADVDDVMPEDAEDNHVAATLDSSTESPHEVVEPMDVTEEADAPVTGELAASTLTDELAASTVTDELAASTAYDEVDRAVVQSHDLDESIDEVEADTAGDLPAYTRTVESPPVDSVTLSSDSEPPSSDSVPADGEPPRSDSVPADGEPPSSDSVPEDGEPPSSDSVPADGEPPSSDSVTADGEPPSSDSVPADGEPPSSDSVPAEGEPPSSDSVPADGEPPSSDSVPADGEPPSSHSVPADGEPPSSDSVTADSVPAGDSDVTGNRLAADCNLLTERHTSAIIVATSSEAQLSTSEASLPASSSPTSTPAADSMSPADQPGPSEDSLTTAHGDTPLSESQHIQTAINTEAIALKVTAPCVAYEGPGKGETCESSGEGDSSNTTEQLRITMNSETSETVSAENDSLTITKFDNIESVQTSAEICANACITLATETTSDNTCTETASDNTCTETTSDTAVNSCILNEGSNEPSFLESNTESCKAPTEECDSASMLSPETIINDSTDKLNLVKTVSSRCEEVLPDKLTDNLDIPATEVTNTELTVPRGPVPTIVHTKVSTPTDTVLNNKNQTNVLSSLVPYSEELSDSD